MDTQDKVKYCKYILQKDNREALPRKPSCKNCLKQVWKWFDSNHNNLELLTTALVGIGMASILFCIGNYFERQNYYNTVLSDYTIFLEKLLVEDRLYYSAINKYLFAESQQIPLAQTERIDEIERKIWRLARANTEMTLRTLSEDDSLGFFGWKPFDWSLLPRRNPERQKILLHLLREAKLGFINQNGQRPEKFLASFFEEINLSRLGPCEKKEDKKCPGLDLDGLPLRLAILQRVNFTGAQLNGAILDSADLKRANLVEVELKKASLVKANLRNAHIRGAELKSANLERANLIGADLHSTNLELAILDGILFDQKTLENILFDGTTRVSIISQLDSDKRDILISRILEGIEQNTFDDTLKTLDRDNIISQLDSESKDKLISTFRHLTLESKENLRLLKSKGIEVKPRFNREPEELNRNNEILLELGFTPERVFYMSDLSGVDLTNAYLVENNLKGASLKNAILKGADLTDAELGGADLMDADLTGATLTRADFTRANLTGVKGANLTNAILCQTTMTTTSTNGQKYEKIGDC